MEDLAVGQLLDGKYRIVRVIGRGAWGRVYEGSNDRLGRRLAIKVLHPEYVERRDMLERFEREARTATKIDSEHVVRIFDLGSLPDGRPYIVMEYLDGEDLGQLISRVKKLEAQKAAIIALQALRGLSEAHAEGILHRDIKPDNFILVRTRAAELVVKIVDFGISKLGGTQNMSMTATGAVLGSPMYMSPEQCRGAKRMDARSDLYSLGVVLFEAVTGRMPYQADTFNELMFKIALEEPPDPRIYEPDLAPGFAAIVVRAMAREPEKRFADASMFYEALAKWLEAQGVNEADWRLGASLTSSATGLRRTPTSLTSSGGTRSLTSSGAKRLTGSAASTLAAPDKVVSPESPSEAALTSSSKGDAQKPSRVGIYVVVGILALAGVGYAFQQQRPERSSSRATESRANEDRDKDPPSRETAAAATTAAPATATAAPGPASAAPGDPAKARTDLSRPRPVGRPLEPRPLAPTAVVDAAVAAPVAVAPSVPVVATPTAPSVPDAGKGVLEGRTFRTTL